MRRQIVGILLFVGLLLTLPTAATAASGSVHVVVRIDGLSDLLLSGNTAQWRHLQYDPPGVTQINGVSWTPSGLSTACSCLSDMFTGVAPAIPQNATGFSVTWTGRGTVTLEELPTAANDYRLRARFDDLGPGGADDYDALISYQSPDPIPALSPWGMIGLSFLLAGGALYFLRRRVLTS
jgi:hypothetical protein